MNRPCENCGTSQLRRFDVRPKQTFWHCPECDLYQKGTLESQTAYEEDYHGHYSKNRSRKLNTAAIRLSALAPHVTTSQPTLLDIGCSVGAIVEAANQLGWQGIGVDVSQTAVDFCRKRDLDCYHFDGNALPFPDESFDTITSWHVIEHVFDVTKTLHDWYRVLKPGGVMVLETPDAGYLKVRLKGARYQKFWAPEHIYTFQKHNLRPFLENVGFEMLPNPILGKPHLLSPPLAGYSLMYRGVHGLRRSLGLSKAFVVYCRRPVLSGAAAA